MKRCMRPLPGVVISDSFSIAKCFKNRIRLHSKDIYAMLVNTGAKMLSKSTINLTITNFIMYHTSRTCCSTVRPSVTARPPK